MQPVAAITNWLNHIGLSFVIGHLALVIGQLSLMQWAPCFVERDGVRRQCSACRQLLNPIVDPPMIETLG